MRPPGPSREQGFVLVAVVGFVLALFFLLIFLYSLSSWEAQFYQRSVDGEQAFQSAVGGIERAKYLLCSVPQARLDDVANASWSVDTNVVAAVALQPPVTSGPVTWSAPDSQIVIRVSAQVRGERRTVEGSFVPGDPPSYYRQLVTASDRLFLDTGTAGDRYRTVDLAGRVWEGAGVAPPPWLDALVTPAAVTPLPMAVQAPDLGSYFAVHPAEVARRVSPSGVGWSLTYQNPQQRDAPVYYCGNPAAPEDFYFADVPMQVHVNGLAVWLFPGGVRFDSRVEVKAAQAQGQQQRCLVIVAGPAGSDNDAEFPDAGIRFRNGLDSEIPVILVSSGRVVIEGELDASAQTNVVADLAIYARDVLLSGPRRATGRLLQLGHADLGALNLHYVDLLTAANALPNTTSALHTLSLVPGSWRATNP